FLQKKLIYHHDPFLLKPQLQASPVGRRSLVSLHTLQADPAREHHRLNSDGGGSAACGTSCRTASGASRQTICQAIRSTQPAFSVDRKRLPGRYHSRLLASIFSGGDGKVTVRRERNTVMI